MILCSVLGKLLGKFGTTGLSEYTFFNCEFMKSKCRSSASDENLVSLLRCAVGAKGPLEFEDSVGKKECKISQ